MKKLKCLIYITVFMLFCTPLSVSAADGDTIVHVTKTGEKYHTGTCSYLKSDIPITLKDAVNQGYTPCSRCHPPTLSEESYSETEPELTIKEEKQTAGINADVIVHITSTGTLYHRKGCTYLKSDISITLAEALQKGYLACSRCDPPTLNSDPETAEDPYVPPAKTTKPKSTNSKKVIKESQPKQTSDNNNSTNIGLYVIIGLGSLIALPYIISLTSSILSKAKEWFIVRKFERDYRESCRRQISLEESEYQHYFKMYAFLSPLSFANMPSNVSTIDNVPIIPGEGKYGKYTVYVSEGGQCYHYNVNCGGSSNKQLLHYFQVAQNKRPCKKCVKEVYDASWYFEFLRIRQIKMKYNIP